MFFHCVRPDAGAFSKGRGSLSFIIAKNLRIFNIPAEIFKIMNIQTKIMYIQKFFERKDFVPMGSKNLLFPEKLSK